MAFSKRNPSEARPSGVKNAPRGSVYGKTPPNSGHRVSGKGRSAPKGAVGGKSPRSRSKPTGGKGNKSGKASAIKGSY